MDRSVAYDYEIALLLGCVLAGLVGLVPAVRSVTLVAAGVGQWAALGYHLGLTAGGVVALCGIARADTVLGRHLHGAGTTASAVSLGIYVAHLATLRPLPVVGMVVLSAVTMAALRRAWRISDGLRREDRGWTTPPR